LRTIKTHKIIINMHKSFVKVLLLSGLSVILFYTTFLFTLSGCSASKTSTEYKPDTNYSKPYYGDGYVVVIYNKKIANNKNDEWAKVVIAGFNHASNYAKSSDELGVGIMFTDESGSGYFVNNNYLLQHKNKEITDKEFVSYIKTKDFPLK
jgi:hypothetical protein